MHNYTLVFPVVLVEEAPVPLAKDLGQPFVVFRFSAIPPFGNFHYFGYVKQVVGLLQLQLLERWLDALKSIYYPDEDFDWHEI